MIAAIPSSRLKILQESFVPVLLVLCGIFVMLIYSEFRVSEEQHKSIVISIAETGEPFSEQEREIAQENVSAGIDENAGEKSNPDLQKAIKAVDEGKYKLAHQILDQLLQGEESSRVYYEKARAYYLQNRLKKSHAFLKKSQKIEPVFLSGYFLQGLVFANQEKYQLAMVSYQKLLDKIPFHYEALYNSGIASLKLDKYKDAVQYFSKAADTSGGKRRARAFYNLALAYRQLPELAESKRKEEAEKYFRASIRLWPSYTKPRYGLASLTEENRKGLKRRAEILQEIVKLKPNDANAHYRLALVYKKLADPQEVMKHLKQALQYAPRHEKSLNEMVLQLIKQKQWAEAESLNNGLIARFPAKTEYIFQAGRIAYSSKHYKQAIEYYQQVLQLDKNSHESWLNIGLAYRKQKNYKEAYRAYQQAIKINPVYPEAFYNMGLLYLKEKNYTEAIKVLQSALKLKPDYAQAWYNLASIYSKTDKPDESIDAYENAVKYRPNYIRAKMNLAIKYVQKGNFDKGISLYQQVLENDESYAIAWLNLGIAYKRLEQFDSAREALTRARQLQPSNTKVIYNIAQTYMSQKNYSGALDEVQLLIEMEPSNSQYRNLLSEVYDGLGEPDRAKEQREKAVKLQEKT